MAFLFALCRITRYNIDDDTYVEIANSTFTVLPGKPAYTDYVRLSLLFEFRKAEEFLLIMKFFLEKISKLFVVLRMLSKVPSEARHVHQFATSLGNGIVRPASSSTYEIWMSFTLVHTNRIKHRTDFTQVEDA